MYICVSKLVYFITFYVNLSIGLLFKDSFNFKIALKKRNRSLEGRVAEDEEMQDEMIEARFRAHFHHMDVERIR